MKTKKVSLDSCDVPWLMVLLYACRSLTFAYLFVVVYRVWNNICTCCNHCTCRSIANAVEASDVHEKFFDLCCCLWQIVVLPNWVGFMIDSLCCRSIAMVSRQIPCIRIASTFEIVPPTESFIEWCLPMCILVNKNLYLISYVSFIQVSSIGCHDYWI